MNEYPDGLNAVIERALNVEEEPRWVSPLKSDGYREFKDVAFLESLGFGHHNAVLREFWPRGGPNWDALATLERATPRVLLVEAKSHVPELYSGGCKATSKASILRIDRSLSLTKRWLNVDDSIDWKGGLYQIANRLAHLYFLREIAKIEAWLVNVYFVGDPRSSTSREQWDIGLAECKRSLGLGTIPYAVNVFLPAKLAGDPSTS